MNSALVVRLEATQTDRADIARRRLRDFGVEITALAASPWNGRKIVAPRISDGFDTSGIAPVDNGIYSSCSVILPITHEGADLLDLDRAPTPYSSAVSAEVLSPSATIPHSGAGSTSLTLSLNSADSPH